jgi:tetratricopeptide (TPR) repeat protein
MRFKQRLTIVLAIVVPPALALALATILGWLHLRCSLTGVGYVLVIYVAWMAVLTGLTEIPILPRGERSGPRRGMLYQAPRSLAEFVGRDEEIKWLTGALELGARVVVSGAPGVGGLGKTELAKIVAHRLARRFRNGVLWADFGSQDPEAVIDGWAAALNVEQLPGDDLAGKAAAWRALVSGRRLLLIFDDVQAGQEIGPLLPSPGCSTVLITTRHADHPALGGVERIDLRPFTAGEGLALAEAVLGPPAARDQTADAVHLFELVGYLPLGVSIALRLARDCGWTLTDLNRQLEKAGAIKVLDRVEDLGVSLAAALETAWENLPDDLRLTFRALALFNVGPGFSTLALAGTLVLEEAEAADRLSRLAGRSLLSQVGEDRWALHPLLRDFAATRPALDETAQARKAAHYLAVARAADFLCKKGNENLMSGLRLFDAEWPHIQAGQAWAAARAQEDDEAARLCSAYPEAGRYFLKLRQHPQVWIGWLEAALVSARRLQDRESEGLHLENLGLAYAARGESQRVIECYEGALAIVREMRQAAIQGTPKWMAARRGEGAHLGNLGLAYAALGDVRQAIEYHRGALVIARELCAASREGSPHWTAARRSEGADLGNLGLAYAALGEAERARDYLKQALAILEEIRSPYAGWARRQLAELGEGAEERRG